MLFEKRLVARAVDTLFGASDSVGALSVADCLGIAVVALAAGSAFATEPTLSELYRDAGYHTRLCCTTTLSRRGWRVVLSTTTITCRCCTCWAVIRRDERQLSA